MKKSLVVLVFLMINCFCYAQEPKNNLGKSLYSMKQEFPELRYIKSDQKGDHYEDGYPEDGMALFFIFKNNYVVEECLICEGKDGYPYEWFKSLIETFDSKNPNKGKNNGYGKEYIFSTFKVNIIYVSENGINTALIIYEKTNNTSTYNTPKTNNSYQTNNSTNKSILKQGKIEWYEIEYTENSSNVRGMTPVGHFSATSSPKVLGSRTYSEAFHSAIKKIQKKAAKKGVRLLLITYKSRMDWDFLTVKVEAVGYK